MIDALLTVNEAADMLRVDIQSVYRWIKCGKIPAYRLAGRAVRILESDIRNHLLTPIDVGEGTDIKRLAAEMIDRAHGIGHNAPGNGQGRPRKGGRDV